MNSLPLVIDRYNQHIQRGRETFENALNIQRKIVYDTRHSVKRIKDRAQSK